MLRERADWILSKIFKYGAIAAVLSCILAFASMASLPGLDSLDWLWLKTASELIGVLVVPIDIGLLFGAGVLCRPGSREFPISYLMFDSRGVTRCSWIGTRSILHWNNIERVQVIGTGANARIIAWSATGYTDPKEPDHPGVFTIAKLAKYSPKDRADWVEVRVRAALTIFSGGRYVAADEIE